MKAVTQHHDVTMETVQALKAKGFTHIRFELKESANPIQAVVEVIPGKDLGFGLDSIALNSGEIEVYFAEVSPMARYFINASHLSP